MQISSFIIVIELKLNKKNENDDYLKNNAFIVIVTWIIFTNLELFLFCGVPQFPNSSNIVVTLFAFSSNFSFPEHKKSSSLFVVTVLPEPDTPVMTMD